MDQRVLFLAVLPAVFAGGIVLGHLILGVFT